MASFTTRVVLHDAEWEDYDELHQYLANAGFARTVTSDKGTTYHLPEAEYDFSGNIARSDVLDMVKSAAARTGKRYSVLVTESAGRTWYNLAKT